MVRGSQETHRQETRGGALMPRMHAAVAMIFEAVGTGSNRQKVFLACMRARAY